tara:strand:- start:135 stop:866 length:732 start_codon:yes stop_codon:yes gene_type:complete
MAENKRRAPNPVISSSLSEAAASSVLDGLDAGFSIDEIAPDKGPKIRGEAKFSQEKLDELVSLSNKGAPIAGQSLTNDVAQPYPWEKPPEFSNPREALDDIVGSIMQPEAVKNIVSALAKGGAVADIGTAILYAKFNEGKISPDAMMMLAEPVMYTIMAIGEEANIQYNIEGKDLDEFDEEDSTEEFDGKVNEFRNVLSDIKKGVTKNIEPSKIDTNVLPESILAQVKEQGPEIRSLLSKGEE